MENKIKDPRNGSEIFSANDVNGYFRLYRQSLEEALNSIEPSALEKAFSLVEKTILEGKRIFSAGNGGSCAIAEHLCCDWMKGTAFESSRPPQVHSLNSNLPLTTAIANDFSFSEIFSKQLEFYGDAGDLLVLISSSGNSPNVVRAAEIALEKKINTLALVGFSGGKLAQISAACIHVKSENYGVVEDVHQTVMHAFAQLIARKRIRGNG